MENTQACSTIESSHIKKSAIVKSGKNNLLVHFEYGIFFFCSVERS